MPDSDYVDRERLYGGRCSDVYKARQKSTGRLVALKVVDVDSELPPHSIKREINALKRLSHPNLLAVIDDYVYGDDRVMVTRLYPYTLQSILPRKAYGYSNTKVRPNFHNPEKFILTTENTLNMDLARAFFKGIIGALAYLHENGIIHRDIKPTNIFLTDDGPDPLSQPVLADVGICFDSKQNMGPEVESKMCLEIASGIYKPIELCLGVETYGDEVDMWQIGVLMTMLFLKNFHLALEAHEVGEGPEMRMNDILLVFNVFNNFGTPIVDEANKDSADPGTYWPEIADPKYYFTSFQFDGNRPRKPASELIPTCTDENLISIFEACTRYRAQDRPTALECLKMLG